MLRPVMEDSRVEVRTSRPDKGVSFRINGNLLENRGIAQRPE